MKSVARRARDLGWGTVGLFCLSLNGRAAESPVGEQIPTLRPPRAEIPPTFWEQYGLWTVAGGVVLLVAVAVLIWFLRRPRPEVIVPPAEVARRGLEPLLKEPESGAVLSQVSGILRRYFNAAFELPPGEMTTSEFCAAMETNRRIGAEFSAELCDFLRRCDERKFAPAASPLPGSVARALEFVSRGEARLRETQQPVPQTPATADAGRSSESVRVQ